MDLNLSSDTGDSTLLSSEDHKNFLEALATRYPHAEQELNELADRIETITPSEIQTIVGPQVQSANFKSKAKKSLLTGNWFIDHIIEFIEGIGTVFEKNFKLLLNYILKRWDFAYNFFVKYLMRQGLLVQKQTFTTDPEHSPAPFSRDWYIRTLEERLPGTDYKKDAAAIVKSIFERKKPQIESANNSCLLWPWFAQWFVEEFFKTGESFAPDIQDKDNQSTRTYSGHQIDLSTLYGNTEARTNVLRSHQNGKLRSQVVNNEVYPIYWKELTPEERNDCPMYYPKNLSVHDVDHLFVLGHARQNLHPGLMLMTTVFLREHNRVCDELVKAYGNSHDDEWYFQTTRNILTGMLLKMVINDYIQHINPDKDIISLKFKPELLAEITDWRTDEDNHRIAAEFNLLYRWHAIIPEEVVDLDGSSTTTENTFWKTSYLTDRGTAKVVHAATAQPTNKFGAHSSPTFLGVVDNAGVRQARDSMKLQSFNAYRKRFGFKPLKSFAELNKDIEEELKEAYHNIDDVEFYVGIMNEKVVSGIFPPTLTKLVLAHAMHGIFSNRLVATKTAWNASTFDEKGVGFDIVSDNSIKKLIARNVNISEALVSFEVVK